MTTRKDVPIVLADLRGGRNGIDSPIDPAFPMTQVVEAWNVDFSDGPLGRKRGGALPVATTGGTAFTNGCTKLLTHVPAGNEAAAELWGIDYAGTPLWKRYTAGAFADVTVSDAISVTTEADVATVVGVTFNGKLFLFYKNSAARSHVWDGSTVRRTSLATPSAPTVDNNPVGGAYPAVLRYYRVRATSQVAGVTVRRSEPSASTSLTPSGAANGVRIYNVAGALSEGETHFEVEVSLDNVTFYVLTTITLATYVGASYLDSAATTSYSSNPISAIAGTFTALPYAKFAVTDNNRLIMAGDYSETFTSRVWWTPVLGSLNKADDERYLNQLTLKGYLDLNEKDGGAITALAGPINNGVIWVFKYRSIWKLVPTGDPDAPYASRCVTRTLGAVNQQSVIMGEDESGAPAIYFLSFKGGYRISAVMGLEYMTRDLEDHWYGLNGQTAVNLSGTLPMHGGYYPQKNQVWWFVTKGSNDLPTRKFCLDIKQATRRDRWGVRGGWSIHDGASAGCTSMVMYATTLGATVSKSQSPYVTHRQSTNILRCDTSDTTDDSATFQGYLTTRNLAPAEALGKTFSLRESLLTAKAGSGVSIQQTIVKDCGLDSSATATVLLTAAGSETRVVKKFEASQQSDLGILQITLGDPAAVASAWTLDHWLGHAHIEAER